MTTEPLRLLLVDEDEPVLRGLQRLLHPLRTDWIIEAATSLTEARALLQAAPFHVVITELRFTDGRGSELLEALRETHPQTLRMVLSSFIEPQEVTRLLQLAHITMHKPATPKELLRNIERARQLLESVTSPQIARALDQFGDRLPRPRVFPRLQTLLESPSASVSDIARLISEDGLLAGRLLRLVNSAAMGLDKPIAAIDRAVALLGLSQVKALVLATEAFEAPGSIRWAVGFDYTDFQEQALARGRLARALVAQDKDIEKASLAGVLLHLGDLIFAIHLPEQYAAVRAIAPDDIQQQLVLEREMAGMHRAELGASLLHLWNLPIPLIEAVAYQFDSRQQLHNVASVNPLAAVVIADALLQLTDAERIHPDSVRAALATLLPDTLLQPAQIQRYIQKSSGVLRVAERNAA